MGTEDVKNEDNQELNIDEWAVVSSMGGRYLGRVVLPLPNATHMPSAVRDIMRAGNPISLQPAFDFLAPMRPVQTPDGKLAMQRDPIVAPVDFTVADMPVWVIPAAVYFCAEMKEVDKRTYKDLVQGGLRTTMSARAQQSGIEIAGSVPSKRG